MQRFRSSQSVGVVAHPLVSGGGLFGSVILFFQKTVPEAARLSLAEGLVDLCAISLESSARLHALVEAHARLRASQDAFVKAERLRALGQMAAGVSHDLKNILNPLSLHLQLIERAAEKKKVAEIKSSIDEMRQVLKRGLQTIQRLRERNDQLVRMVYQYEMQVRTLKARLDTTGTPNLDTGDNH